MTFDDFGLIEYGRNKNNNEIKRAIVFVHGLFGSKNSWYDENNIDSPRFINRFVKDEILDKNFRIFQYHYPTSLFQLRLLKRILNVAISSYRGRLNNSINTIALDFTQTIKSLLQNEGIEVITLVGHSMGGIILKQSFMLLNDQEISKIANYTTLSSPHLGTRIANIFGRIVKMFGNPQVAQLMLFSDYLRDLSIQFNSKVERLNFTKRIYCQGGLSDEVVDVNAAILGFANDNHAFRIEANHYSILTPNDQNPVYVTLKKKIKELATEFTIYDFSIGKNKYNLKSFKKPTFKNVMEFVFEHHIKDLRNFGLLAEHQNCELIFDPRFSSHELNTPLDLKRELKAQNLFQLLGKMGSYVAKGEKPINYCVELKNENYYILKN